MESLPIKTDKLFEFLLANRAAGVGYGFGEKDPTPTKSLPIDYSAIDCSGFMRCLIYYATEGQVLLPDGSYLQRQWLKERFERGQFEDQDLRDSAVRICVFVKRESVGHIWLVLNGYTMESCSGRGPTSRDWKEVTHFPPFVSVFKVT